MRVRPCATASCMHPNTRFAVWSTPGSCWTMTTMFCPTPPNAERRRERSTSSWEGRSWSRRAGSRDPEQLVARRMPTACAHSITGGICTRPTFRELAPGVDVVLDCVCSATTTHKCTQEVPESFRKFQKVSGSSKKFLKVSETT